MLSTSLILSCQHLLVNSPSLDNDCLWVYYENMKWLALLPEIIKRIPLERLITRAPDNKKRLEELQEILGTAEPKKMHEEPQPEPVQERHESLGEIAEEVRSSTEVATGCVPCALSHFGTVSGLLNEAMRFARKDGLESNEVLDRINKSLDELNTLERVDLDSEKIYALPPGEKEIAIKALNASRATRHALESLTTVDELEKVTADVQTIRKDIGRDWYRYRLSQIPKEKLTETDLEAIGGQESQG